MSCGSMAWELFGSNQAINRAEIIRAHGGLSRLWRNKIRSIVFRLRGAAICSQDLGTGSPARGESREAPAAPAWRDSAQMINQGTPPPACWLCLLTDLCRLGSSPPSARWSYGGAWSV